MVGRKEVPGSGREPGGERSPQERGELFFHNVIGVVSDIPSVGRVFVTVNQLDHNVASIADSVIGGIAGAAQSACIDLIIGKEPICVYGILIGKGRNSTPALRANIQGVGAGSSRKIYFLSMCNGVIQVAITLSLAPRLTAQRNAAQLADGRVFMNHFHSNSSNIALNTVFRSDG